MAVAAYATLQSLSRVLNNLQHPARLRRLHVDTNQIQSLQEKVQFLLDFLEAHSQRISEEIGGLGRQIADAAAEAEEVVDRHVVDQLRDRSQEESHRMTALSSFCHDIDTVIGKIDSLAKELTMMVKEEWADVHEEQRAIYEPVRSKEVLPSGDKKSTMVGFDEHLERIVDKLTRGEPNLQILPIVGMGGSRVMVTTRESSLAIFLDSQESYSIDLLNEDKSWNLLCHKAFSQEGCPYPYLEEVGKTIARSCNGLPLTIAVMGGLLANSKMTLEYWESIAENVSTFRNSEDYERCLNILSLSYNNLPIHMKPCFLYMVVFPEDANILVSRLTKLWIAEGFLKPIKGQSLEEVAEIYLRYLIDRNLILSLKLGYDGNIETCGIHDLVRDICLREYKKEHFRYAPRVQQLYVSSSRVCDECFLCGSETALRRIDLDEVHDVSQQTSLASVLVCNTCRNFYPSLNKARFVRVRIVSRKNFSRSYRNEEMLTPTSLRYLELRHFLGSCDVVLPDQAVNQDSIIMENLQTLTKVRDFRCTKEVLERMPNLKKFGSAFSREMGSMEWPDYSLHNLVHLHKLEALFIQCEDLLLENLTFPTSLKKLRLDGCNIPWENMMTIGSLLPNLEVLELFHDAFKGPEWNQVEGEFSRLKVLTIFESELMWWRAEDTHFPSLEHLILTGMAELKEIPLCIGDIPTLHSIHLKNCNASLMELAKQIVRNNMTMEMRVFNFI
ncbi:UNVERIFIED_CONTAM: putative disease resistance protein [Sesamum angustifolium]|uniref:Disease resistance protein n=1 Tax=Sesamum angustifolium TaxID=2727405 RepID=A0AAW2LH31_9LAMI